MSRNILFVSETYLPVDGRALRFATALGRAGDRICGAGFRERDLPLAETSAFDRILVVRRPRGSRLRRYWLPVSLTFGAALPRLAQLSYWLQPHRHLLFRKIIDDASNPGNRPDLVIAKHWSAGPLGLAVAKVFNVPFVYDANELSFAEHEQNWKWRLLAQPVIRELDRVLLKHSALVTTIGKGVADAITAEYDLVTPPTIVRNIPDSPANEPREPGSVLRFIYIGLAHPVRHLEDIIESVAEWSKGRTLVLQLTGDRDYIRGLRRLAAQRQVEDRITFRDPVPDSQIVDSLGKADVGLCLFRTFSRQMLNAEPNKFYQYLLGGLPVLASEVPRLAELVDTYECGWSLPGKGAAQIAAAINAIDHRAIIDMHAGVRNAQANFKWKNEAERLTDAIALIGDHASGKDG